MKNGSFFENALSVSLCIIFQLNSDQKRSWAYATNRKESDKRKISPSDSSLHRRHQCLVLDVLVSHVHTCELLPLGNVLPATPLLTAYARTIRKQSPKRPVVISDSDVRGGTLDVA